MEYSYEDLKHKSVAELREIAEKTEHEAIDGYTAMHKEQLLPALCTALGIEAHEHHVVVGVNKKILKAHIRELKKQRDAALEAHDHKRLKTLRRKIHHIKRKLHKATV